MAIERAPLSGGPHLVSWATQACRKACFCPCESPCLVAGAPTLGAEPQVATPVLRRFDRSGRLSAESRLIRGDGSIKPR